MWRFMVMATILFMACSSEPTPEEKAEKAAEEMEEKLESLASAFKEKAEEEKKVVKELSYKQLMEFLPKAPSGWQAEKPKGATMKIPAFGSYAQTQQSFKKNGKEIQVQIVYAPELMRVPGLYLPMVEYENEEGWGRGTTYKGYKAFEEEKGNRYTFAVLIKDHIAVVVAGDKDEKETIKEIVDEIDLDNLEDLLED